MGEGLSKKLSPNLLKGATAAVDIGSQAIYRASVQIDNLEAIAIIDARRKISRRHKRPHLKFTRYEVQGHTSTFGWPTDGYTSNTADGGNTDRPCIAIQNDSTLGRKFQLIVFYNHKKYQGITYQCDYGPGISYRAIDINGKEVVRLHMNPHNYPTDHALGIARDIKGPKVR